MMTRLRMRIRVRMRRMRRLNGTTEKKGWKGFPMSSQGRNQWRSMIYILGRSRIMFI